VLPPENHRIFETEMTTFSRIRFGTVTTMVAYGMERANHHQKITEILFQNLYYCQDEVSPLNARKMHVITLH
jgi:hypothetical protein